ncbi:hypothetical protein HPP92_013516 [Vanilla planifolia]|uniref:Uncharacterized protein n=1 Tax=Vanilla planifolia TaxID=51239 RepID=A0A835R3P2_VANPL|nr:hypothetical protein HPP92_013516 [Vanilla planifolia]
METVVVVARHQNQSVPRRRLKKSDRFGSNLFGNLKGISCRSFQPCIGILPSRALGVSCSFLTQATQNPLFHSEPPKPSSRVHPSVVSAKPSPTKVSSVFNDQTCSERWAGPTYSNSPPPTSLPMPNFSLRQKRSLSLELPVDRSGIALQQGTKSAPASPTWDSPVVSRNSFLNNASATKNLRRILNLDLSD